jgi:hypothetical protein
MQSSRVALSAKALIEINPNATGAADNIIFLNIAFLPELVWFE